MLEVGGAAMIPGLIDAHVHLGWGPGDSPLARVLTDPSP